MAQATDTSGNVGQAGRTLPIADVEAPVITSLATTTGVTAVVPGETVSITATATDAVGVQSMAFTATSGAFTTSQAVPTSGTAATAAFSFVVPADLASGAQVLVTARARDAAGNESELASLTLGSGDTTPPAVVILQPAADFQGRTGQAITFRVRATDQVGVRRILFKARAGEVTVFEDSLNLPDPPPSSVENGVTIPVAANAPLGPWTLTAQAVDVGTNVSPVASVVVSVLDGTSPTAAIQSPASGAEVDPRQPIAVRVGGADSHQLQEVGVSYRLAGGLADLGRVSRLFDVPGPLTTASILDVTLTPAQVPARAAQLVLTPFARDMGGNEAVGPAVTITLRDVVPPTLVTVSPNDGATGVDPDTLITASFSEPMDPATLTSSNVQLRRGASVVATTIVDRRQQHLGAPDAGEPAAGWRTRSFTIALTGLRDAGGNALPDQTSTFRTVSPDTAGPKVIAVEPANNAVGVAASAPVTVTFSEAIDPATVTAASFRVSVDGSAVAGTRTLLDGNTKARFTPSSPYGFEKTVVVELTGAIRDAANNALVKEDGSAITTPITSTFLTGNFAITSPASATVLENAPIALEAQASADLAPTRSCSR